MAKYSNPNQELWTGRISSRQLYLHEKVSCMDIATIKKNSTVKTFALLGYACDEGVKRNQGRVGAVEGPDTIRKQLGKMPNHLAEKIRLVDVGNVECLDSNMESAQLMLSEQTTHLLSLNVFPILLGGGHDMAYGHFNGVKNHFPKSKTIGIINFDAHFDLRSNENGNNSGTPFYQIAQDCKTEERPFKYLGLGIRGDANDKILYETAQKLNVTYLDRQHFNVHYLEHVQLLLLQFIEDVDYVYTTIDLDGFSSAYAPGVSAASPMGFSPDIVKECLKLIMDSKKLISLDIAEMNPKYDLDNQTAKLAASLIHYIVHKQ